MEITFHKQFMTHQLASSHLIDRPQELISSAEEEGSLFLK